MKEINQFDSYKKLDRIKQNLEQTGLEASTLEVVKSWAVPSDLLSGFRASLIDDIVIQCQCEEIKLNEERLMIEDPERQGATYLLHTLLMDYGKSETQILIEAESLIWQLRIILKIHPLAFDRLFSINRSIGKQFRRGYHNKDQYYCELHYLTLP